MGYEKEVMARAIARHAQAVSDHKEQQTRRRELIYHRLPEVFALDGEIQANMVEVMKAAFSDHQDPTAAVQRARQKNAALQQRRRALLDAADLVDIPEGPLCRKCSDVGYIGETMCDCFRAICQEEQRKELTSLGAFRGSFDDFRLDYYSDIVNPVTGLSPRAQMELVYETCVNYASHFSPKKSKNLLMSGATGLGKTFLSACIAEEVVERGFSVAYETASDALFWMNNRQFGRATEAELRSVERMLHCDLLILDDLGTENDNRATSPALYTIINSRLNLQMPTIISTNLSIAQIEQRYTPQITSRLAGDYFILSFAGSDIRRLRSHQ